MKELSRLLIIFLSLVSCNTERSDVSVKINRSVVQTTDTAEMTNNFYDNSETYALPVKDLVIEGEIANPGKVDFSKLPRHSIIVKETLLDSAGGDRFTGAYRYDGYSLFDILDGRILRKANISEFNPIIDLYIEIENAAGEKVIFSWGEIYYPNNLHKIIIASDVARIIPSKTKELWPLPLESRIVAGCDLITERNISGPVKITVRSIRRSFPVVKGMSPMYSSDIKLFKDNKQIALLKSFNKSEQTIFNTVFYGRGRGIHSTTPFKGMLLRDVIGEYYAVNKENLQTGIFCLTGKDGYRCAVSFSELFNRNDQEEFLLVSTKPEEDGGLYRVFAACDFFSDRAIKSLTEIHLGD